MKMKSTCALLFLMSNSLAFPFNCCAWSDRTQNEKIGIGVAVSAGVLAGTYLLYRLFTWEPSNAKVLYRAQRVYDTVHDTYKPMDLMDKVDTLPRYTEQDLATIAFQRDV